MQTGVLNAAKIRRPLPLFPIGFMNKSNAIPPLVMWPYGSYQPY